MNERILILAPPNDFHAACVAWALARYKVAVDWMDFGSVTRPSGRAMAFQERAHRLLDGEMQVPRYTKIWRRRTGGPKMDPELGADAKFVHLESETFDRNFLDMLCAEHGDVVLNDRLSVLRAENKQLQLVVAARCGLPVPDTLISQDPRLVRVFVGSHESSIVKPLMGQLWSNSATGKLHMTTTSVLPKSALRDPNFDASVSFCPAIYQTKVEKVSDLRVVVFGRHIVCVEVASKVSDPVDCRVAINEGRASGTERRLDEATTKAIFEMCSRLGISYASMDLARKQNGELVFLDLNPAGQFLFVEDLCTSTMLLDRFARYLGGDIEADPEISPGVTLAEFERSAACKAWVQRWTPDTRKVNSDAYLLTAE